MDITHSPVELQNEYLLVQNIKTGEQVIIDKKLTRYKKITLGFLNSIGRSSKFVKHIILTQREESYSPMIINYFLSAVRRFYGDVVYVWTVEAQQRGVLHWHIIIGFDYTVKFGAEDIQRLQKYWKYGSLEVVPVRRVNFRYLLKYITKSLGSSLGSLFKIRRIGSSMISAYLKQSYLSLERAINFFGRVGIAFQSFNEFFWSNGNAYLETDTKERLCVYRRAKSDWFRVDVLQGEPF